MRMHAFMVAALLAVAPLSCSVARAAETARPAAVAAAHVNVNTADAAALAAGLKGVGLKKAEAIVAWRKAHGPFSSLEQFQAVKGIGPGLVARNKGVIVFN